MLARLVVNVVVNALAYQTLKNLSQIQISYNYCGRISRQFFIKTPQLVLFLKY
jgi:hypothetical protein